MILLLIVVRFHVPSTQWDCVNNRPVDICSCSPATIRSSNARKIIIKYYHKKKKEDSAISVINNNNK